MSQPSVHTFEELHSIPRQPRPQNDQTPSQLLQLQIHSHWSAHSPQWHLPWTTTGQSRVVQNASARQFAHPVHRLDRQYTHSSTSPLALGHARLRVTPVLGAGRHELRTVHQVAVPLAVGGSVWRIFCWPTCIGGVGRMPRLPHAVSPCGRFPPNTVQAVLTHGLQPPA